ncbi:MAG: helix-turn-helix domain-containing protein [Actinomycetota bacterium]
MSTDTELLVGLRHAVEVLESEKTKAVRRARQDGESWAAIARALGISRQAAWERYGQGIDDSKES